MAHLCICIFLHGVDFGLQTGEVLAYCSHSYTMVRLVSGGLLPKKFSATILSTMPANAPLQDRRYGKSSV